MSFRNQPQQISPTFDKLNELNKIDFGLLSSRNFTTMATWRNDFSSLADRFEVIGLGSQKGLAKWKYIKP